VSPYPNSLTAFSILNSCDSIKQIDCSQQKYHITRYKFIVLYVYFSFQNLSKHASHILVLVYSNFNAFTRYGILHLIEIKSLVTKVITLDKIQFVHCKSSFQAYRRDIFSRNSKSYLPTSCAKVE
jgi:hypothetical protein